MPQRSYLDFDLLIESAGPGRYRARVLASPAGESRPVPVEMPFSDLEFENLLLRVGQPRRHAVRSLNSPEVEAVRDFGGRLFDAVFHDQLRATLDASVQQVESADAGLRIRLRLADSPELSDLPWEYLYDRDARRFLALSEWTPVVRYLDLASRIRPLSVHPPLRILVMAASPTDFDPLDVKAEWARVRDALRDVRRTGRVVVERVRTGTLADLRRQLLHSEYHVFHFIGHGRYDPQAQDGVLALEGPNGRAQLISGADLGAMLHDHRSLRLALLNSCEGARGGRTDPYAGTAQSLIYQGIPAVVAMQFEITDGAAITFAHSLYEAVADGYPLDAAMSQARNAIRDQPNPVEWATPVLYLRAPDGRIFDVSTAPSEPAPPTSPTTPQGEGGEGPDHDHHDVDQEWLRSVIKTAGAGSATARPPVGDLPRLTQAVAEADLSPDQADDLIEGLRARIRSEDDTGPDELQQLLTKLLRRRELEQEKTALDPSVARPPPPEVDLQQPAPPVPHVLDVEAPRRGRTSGKRPKVWLVGGMATAVLAVATLLVVVMWPRAEADHPQSSPRVVRVNFQSPDAPVPNGYIADWGEPYGPKVRGDLKLTFGWVHEGTTVPVSIVSQGRDRNLNPDQRQDTLIHMEGWDPAIEQNVPAAWEIALPNGRYAVFVSVGDKAYNSVNTINVEGVTAIKDFRNSAEEPYQENNVEVDLTDGRLTIDSIGGDNTKINYAIVTRL